VMTSPRVVLRMQPLRSLLHYGGIDDIKVAFLDRECCSSCRDGDVIRVRRVIRAQIRPAKLPLPNYST